MKIKVEINLDMSSGEYEIQFFSHKKEDRKIDQSEVMRLLRKVFEQWDTKFKD
jgi:hypothetical protein